MSTNTDANIENIKQLSQQLDQLKATLDPLANAAGGGHDFLTLFTVFVLAGFIGFYVVWSVTPALHSPLMGVTNAISSVVIVGAILALVSETEGLSPVIAFIAIALASVNIFGGFIITARMLAMFKKKEKR